MADVGSMPEADATQQLREAIQLLNHKIDILTSSAGSAQLEHTASWFKYQQELMKYNTDLLHWQLLASNVLLWVVVAVVAAGVIYSGVQLATAMRAGKQTSNSLEISAQRVRITSSVVGVTILTLSLAFLLIFVEQVYRVRGVDTQLQKNVVPTTETHTGLLK